MRAIILLALLLALIALFSYHEPLTPYWKSRFPAVVSCLDEGRYRDALAAAMAGDPPGVKSTRWAKSEPLGEAAPVEKAAPEEEAALVDPSAPGEETAPVEEITPDASAESPATHVPPAD